jgi:hypothetical protein
MSATTETKSIEQQIVEQLRMMSTERQQQVLTFAEFLHHQFKKEQTIHQGIEGVSAYDLTKDLAGCLEGEPSDLSTNKAYLQELKAG